MAIIISIDYHHHFIGIISIIIIPLLLLLTFSLKLTNFEMKLDFKADSYSLDPMSVCMQAGSFSIDLAVENIEVRADGRVDIWLSGWGDRLVGRRAEL